MPAPADDAEIVEILGEAPRQLAVRELVIHDHLVHRERQRPRELLNELAVLAFVGLLEEIAPQRIGYGAYFLVGPFDDVQAVSFCSRGVWVLVGTSSATK